MMMASLQHILALLLFIILVVVAKRYRRQANTEMSAWTGEKISLKCGDDMPEPVIRFWRKGFDVLAVANIVLSQDERVSVINNSMELQIANVTHEDGGEYVCLVKIKPQFKHVYHLRVRELVCESPMIPLNGGLESENRTDNDSYRFGHQIHYYCNKGFHLAGSVMRTCSDPYKGWSGENPSCESEFIARLRNRMDDLENKLMHPERLPGVAIEPKAMTLLESKITTIESRVTSLEGGVDIRSRTQQRIDDIDATLHRIRTANNLNIHRSRWEKLLHGDLAMLAEKDGYLVSEFTWYVEKFDEKVAQHRAEKFPYLESKPFYTNIPGYRMKLHLYPDYDNTNHIGVYAILVRGEFDEVLAWPFTSRYEVSLVSRDETDVVYDVVIPAKVPLCNFERPPPDNIIGCGFAALASLETLKSKKDLYMYDGAIVLKIAVYLNYT